MSFSFYLYRAVDNLGPWSTWNQMHAEPLGTRREVQAKIESVFAASRWERTPESAWACYDYDDTRFPREVRLMGGEDEPVLYVITYSGPPAIRALMTSLGLNYCYASESDELYHPFAAGEQWPGEAAR